MKTKQMSLPMINFEIDKDIPVINPFLHSSFSHNSVCIDSVRLNLEHSYKHLFVNDDRFNRKVVSFQANKGEIVHSWIKYREGFSSVYC